MHRKRKKESMNEKNNKQRGVTKKRSMRRKREVERLVH